MSHNSPCFYPKPAKFETKSQIAPNQIVFHIEMSDAAVRLLLAINGISTCAPSWRVIQTDLQKRLRWGRDKMRNTIKECVILGYMKVRQSRSKINLHDENHKIKKGQYIENEFEYDLEGGYLKKTNEIETPLKPQALSVEAFKPLTDNPSTECSSSENKTLPMPNIPIPNKQALKKALPAKALPFSKTKKAALKASPSAVPSKSKFRNHKRTDEKEELFQWLRGLTLPNGNLLLDEHTASYITSQNERKRLEDTYCHLLSKLQSGAKVNNPAGLFRTLLTKEHNPIGRNSILNESFAKKIANDLGWETLKIKEKYVEDLTMPGKEFPLNMEPESFRISLEQFYLSLHSRN